MCKGDVTMTFHLLICVGKPKIKTFEESLSIYKLNFEHNKIQNCIK